MGSDYQFCDFTSIEVVLLNEWANRRKEPLKQSFESNSISVKITREKDFKKNDRLYNVCKNCRKQC